MLDVFIDIETLPDPNGDTEYIEAAKGSVKVPNHLTKPKLIDALSLGSDAKYKTVDELKELWIKQFGVEQERAQGNENWRKTSFDGGKGQICVIGLHVEGGKEFHAFNTSDLTEGEMLNAFWSWLSRQVGSHQWRFVAHNAKFDLPFLYHRSVVNGVKPLPYNHHGRHGQHHYCTMEQWAGYGGRISMDNLANILCVTGKGDMDGSKVYDTWQKDPQKVIDYCRNDVRMLVEVYNRMEFVE